MSRKILVGTIEGKVKIVEEQDAIQVGDDEWDIEFLSDWVSNNLPAEGQYVRIEIMVFPEG